MLRAGEAFSGKVNGGFPACWLAVVALVSCGLIGTPANAADKVAAMVIDANTGVVLHDRSVDESRHPASLTKMMTLYLLFERMEQGRLALSTRIKVSEQAASTQPSKLGLKAGEEISVQDAIRALVTKSANDVAVAVAELLAGNEETFSVRMTAKARQLGMKGTVFKNASGLPDNEQVTTARDMVALALALNDHFPKQWTYFATTSFHWHGSSHRNHNTLLFSFQGVDGIKTGYTRASGFNLVSSVRRGEKHVIAAVFGGSSAATRNAEMRYLLTRALLKASSQRTRQPAMLAKSRESPREAPPLQVAVRERPAPVSRSARSEPGPATAAATTEPTQMPASAGVEPPVPRPTAGPVIEIARVRPILLALQPRPVAAAEPAAPLREFSANSLPPVAALPPVTRSSLAQPSEAAGTLPVPSHIDTPAAVAREASLLQLRPALGRAPSTLQQQAEVLSRIRGAETTGSDTLPALADASASLQSTRSALRGPEQAPPSASNTPVQRIFVQVGAFATQAEAERQITSVRDRAASILDGYNAIAYAAHASGRTVYRARFGGFEARSATAACIELRRRQIDCFVTKAE